MKSIDSRISLFENSKELIELIDELYEKLKEFFDGSVELNIEIDDDEIVWGRIKSSLALTSTLIALDNLESTWYFERTGYINNSPVLTIE